MRKRFAAALCAMATGLVLGGSQLPPARAAVMDAARSGSAEIAQPVDSSRPTEAPTVGRTSNVTRLGLAYLILLYSRRVTQ